MRDKNGRFTTKNGKIYYVTIECKNCRYGDSGEHTIEISKGIEKDDWLRGYECPLCGCKTMKEKSYI